MKITIGQPLGYSNIGKKDRQEDAVWPLFEDATVNNRCFSLCDGVGGSEHGEIASEVTSKTIVEYISTIIDKKSVIDVDDIQDAVDLAYDELEKVCARPEANDSTVQMATTLTCVCIHNEGIMAAHIGDSRIYLVRPKTGLLYQSLDHSLVNTLLQAGEISPEEAKTFPRKNVITKAIQPYGKKRFKAEVYQLTDIQAGDYLFLCCDGVLEALTNERLVEILSLNISDEGKIALIASEGAGKIKDNNTAYLIPIKSVSGESALVNDDLSFEVEIQSKDSAIKQYSQDRADSNIEKKKQKVSVRVLLYGAVLLSLLLGMLFIYKTFTIESSLSSPSTTLNNYLHNNFLKHSHYEKTIIINSNGSFVLCNSDFLFWFDSFGLCS